MKRHVDAQQVEEFVALAKSRNSELGARVRGLHPAQLADLLESLPAENRAAIWLAAPPRERGEMLLELHDDAREALVGTVPVEQLVDAVVELEADEIADLDAVLPDEVLQGVIRGVSVDRYRDIERLRAYAHDTAGGLMNVDTLAVRPDMRLAAVQRYLRSLRRVGGDLPEHLDSIQVVDRQQRLVGALGLAELVAGEPMASVESVMDADPIHFEAGQPATEVARMFADHDLLSAPVVDESGYLVGRITVDDVVDVIRDAGERGALRPAGLDEEVDLFAPPLRSVRRRGAWLCLNLLNAFIAAWVIGLFEGAIESMVALAILMPVVASMGGVAGNQSLALVIRALALDQVNRANVLGVLSRETLVGLLNGVAFAALVAFAAYVWFGNALLGGIFALGMLINLLVGTVMGAVFPLALRALGVDPALAGGVVLTATTDVVGFCGFLGLATLFVT